MKKMIVGLMAIGFSSLVFAEQVPVFDQTIANVRIQGSGVPGASGSYVVTNEGALADRCRITGAGTNLFTILSTDAERFGPILALLKANQDLVSLRISVDDDQCTVVAVNY